MVTSAISRNATGAAQHFGNNDLMRDRTKAAALGSSRLPWNFLTSESGPKIQGLDSNLCSFPVQVQESRVQYIISKVGKRGRSFSPYSVCKLMF